MLRERGEADVGDLAQEFGLKGADRRALREMLKALEKEGKLGKRGRKGFAEAGALPPVGVADVVEKDSDGDLFVRLTKAGEDAPLVVLVPGKGEKAAGPAPGLGDRLLVRFERCEDGEIEARLIKRLGQSAHRVLGVIRKNRKRGARRAGGPPLQGQPDRARGGRGRSARRRSGAGPGRRLGPALRPQARQDR